MSQNCYDPRRFPISTPSKSIGISHNNDQNHVKFNTDDHRTVKKEMKRSHSDINLNRPRTASSNPSQARLSVSDSNISITTNNEEDDCYTDLTTSVYAMASPDGKKLIYTLFVPVVISSDKPISPKWAALCQESSSSKTKKIIPVSSRRKRVLSQSRYSVYCASQPDPSMRLEGPFTHLETCALPPGNINCCNCPNFSPNNNGQEMLMQPPCNYPILSQIPPQCPPPQPPPPPQPQPPNETPEKNPDIPPESLETEVIEANCPAYDYLTFNQFQELGMLMRLPCKGFFFRFLFILLMSLIYFLIALCLFFYLCDKLEIGFIGTPSEHKTEAEVVTDKNFWDVITPRTSDLWRQCF